MARGRSAAVGGRTGGGGAHAQCNLPDELDEHDGLTKEKEEWETGDAENDENELSFNEFCKLLARVCNAKIPEANRGGAAFEVTLESWHYALSTSIIPFSP